MITRHSCALGATLALALATAAVADPTPASSLRIPVGDLTSPAAAHALQQRIDVAAARLCEPSYALVDLGGWGACLSSVRDEAMRQLTPAEQQAFAASLRKPVALAAR